MIKVYYLDGLGGNRRYVGSLTREMSNQSLDLVYLPLPGHPEALDELIESPEELLAWFEALVLEDQVYLMGYSLGADLAAYLADASAKVKGLILLDGGIWSFEGYSLEQELIDSRAYLAEQRMIDLEEKIAQEAAETPNWTEDLEQAVRLSYIKTGETYSLNLNEDSICALLALRREIVFYLSKKDFARPCLLILSDSPESFYQEKLAQVAKIPNDKVQVETLANTSHQLYLEKPETIAYLAHRFIDAKKHLPVN